MQKKYEIGKEKLAKILEARKQTKDKRKDKRLQAVEWLKNKPRVGNHRNLTLEEEAKLLQHFEERARKGQLITVQEIKEVYIEKMSHSIGSGQIYYVLKRHYWRKVMPRSKHPKKASEAMIEASKKLTERKKN